MEWTRGPTIGRGATACVHVATDNRTGELFAVKSTELCRSTFLRNEQSLLSKLASPRIISYLGFSITTEPKNDNDNNETPTYNLFVEYFPNGTLFDSIQRTKLDEPTIKLYARQILEGLEYLHGNGIAHCDIKSRNVLIGGDGAKIADLGSAKRVKESDPDRPNFSGTPGFMSPEVARGERQGFEADVWALGCVVVEMSSGEGPWTGSAVSALYRVGFSGSVPEIPTWLSEKGRDFLRRCFERDWRRRWTVGQLLEHPFVDGSEMISPSSVLGNKGFLWDFVEVRESQRGFDFGECSVLSSVRDRIRVLIGDEAFCDYDDDDDDWLIIRSNEDSEDIDDYDYDYDYDDELRIETSIVNVDHHEEEHVFDGFSFGDDELSFDFSVETNSSFFSDTSFVMPCNNQSEMRNINFSFDSFSPLLFYRLKFMGFFFFFFSPSKKQKKSKCYLEKITKIYSKDDVVEKKYINKIILILSIYQA